MLLTETIKSTTSAIQKRRTVQENKKSTEDYSKALRQLAQANDTLKTTLDCAVMMESAGIVEHPLMMRPVRDELVEYAGNCGKGIYEGKLTLDMVIAFKAKGDAVAEQIKIVWKDAATKYAEGTKGYLSMIGGLTDNPKQAKELADSISKTVNGALSVTSIKKLVADVDEAKRITDGFSLNPEIEAFLQKVSSQQATIVDLTPNVLTWLKEKKLTSKLKVRF